MGQGRLEQRGFGAVVLLVVLVVGALVGVIAFTLLRSDDSSDTASSDSAVTSGSQQNGTNYDALHKSNLGRLSGSVNEYMTNNNGLVPGVEILQAEAPINPATDAQYVIVSTEPVDSQVQYATGSQCAEDGSGIESSGSRSFVLRIALYDQSLYCI